MPRCCTVSTTPSRTCEELSEATSNVHEVSMKLIVDAFTALAQAGISRQTFWRSPESGIWARVTTHGAGDTGGAGGEASNTLSCVTCVGATTTGRPMKKLVNLDSIMRTVKIPLTSLVFSELLVVRTEVTRTEPPSTSMEMSEVSTPVAFASASVYWVWTSSLKSSRVTLWLALTLTCSSLVAPGSNGGAGGNDGGGGERSL
jgi:hypothetical protein